MNIHGIKAVGFSGISSNLNTDTLSHRLIQVGNFPYNHFSFGIASVCSIRDLFNHHIFAFRTIFLKIYGYGIRISISEVFIFPAWHSMITSQPFPSSVTQQVTIKTQNTFEREHVWRDCGKPPFE